MCPDHALSVSKLVVAVDGSWQSTTAVKLASEVAKGLAAELTILHVIPSAEDRPPVAGTEGARQERGGQSILHAATEVAKAAGVKVKTELRKGRVADQILQFAERYKPDVIVMGSRGMSREKGLLLGSVSQAVSQYSKCSVLIVR